ncbi:UNVERIFIED_CONTAM: hypothetical protein RMT77_000381 [Armadillidium vulgare]
MDTYSKHFGIYDYIIFGTVLFISAAIGMYYRFTGGRQKTFKEYLLADQKMSSIPVAFSLMASFMSAITILGVSKEIYSFGTQFFIINISYIISTPIVCYLFLPVFYRLQKISVYEYLELRFGRATRLLASVAFTLQMTLYMGIVLYAPALALSAVTGISQNISIVTVGFVCTFYSALGGMKAVLITDVFQSLLMFAAVFAVIFKGLMDFSIQEIIQIAKEGQRLEFFVTSLDPRVRHTVWNLSIGGIFTYCSLYGVNQAQVQRLLTVKSLRKARTSLWLQWIILLTLSFSTCFSGLILYAQYWSCDPLKSGQIQNSDQILPLYVVENLGHIPGISGLFVSGIFSGSLSTVSSSLNSLSAVTLQDYLLPVLPSLTGIGEKRAAALGKVIAVLFGAICVGIAFLTQLIGAGVLQASLTIFGAVGGPLLSVFTMGMLFRVVNQRGAICGLLSGLIISLWIGFGEPKPPLPFKPLRIDGCSVDVLSLLNYTESHLTTVNTSLHFNDVNSKVLVNVTNEEPSSGLDDYNFLHELYAVSYMWVSTIGFLVTLIVGLCTSCSSISYRENIDKRLLSKIVWRKSDFITAIGQSEMQNEDASMSQDKNSTSAIMNKSEETSL